MTQQIPEEVKKLIIRKLRHKKREQERLWVSIPQAAYKKMNEGIVANISSGALGRAFTSVPLEAYSEIAAGAIAVSKEWPRVVWEIIASLMDKAHLNLLDGQELNVIVNEFSWAIEQSPFTLDYINPDHFKESVHREVRRYGVDRSDIMDSFNREMDIASGSAKSAILNTARNAREEVGIAIEEFLIVQKTSNNTKINEPPAQRKQRLENWYQEEHRVRGKSGAINRTAEREGITRQTLSAILKRQG